MDILKPSRVKPIAIAIGCLVSLCLLLLVLRHPSRRQSQSPTFDTTRHPPLVMKGGNPYIRALMRTIAASEASDRQPYSVIYGGSHAKTLDRHPEKCIRIVSGPNINNCSTAAGRYQMINTTWFRMAKKYHPQPDCLLFFFQCTYSFEPEYQDAVVHAWLSDESAWNMNIPQLLKDGKLEEVRKRLSSTWTSLGYGIETNSITPKLAGIYQRLVKEESGL
ncbi:glycoside hydrolase family protein [Chamaesiphon minutus]|uniref:Muramidase (Phage lambda lysozyme) n=1 Tax=Chamaesiphon minutus (strain ATCC 27169 / PCC 6605) TaxID=1173020 RepID=K9UMF3_CHAP6|nr:glycoside hydrolase family protein [Chamaesiphon minutus]AFY96267.1 muramidase (phage lambda lysozyme) [Chamaesiphon minutus PCC 6605]